MRTKLVLICLALSFYVPSALAFDSYRYLHVSIETPWAIFLFLLPIVMLPFILMAFLYWRFAGRRRTEEKRTENKI